MDVGFNNTNTLHLALDEKFFEDVEWIIEATSDEQLNVWKEFHEMHEWKQVPRGMSYTILNLEVFPQVKESKVYSTKKLKKESLPVVIEFSFAIVDGHKIAFYTSNSLLTHNGYIEAFLTTYFQRTHHKYTRWNHANATNAHNCLNYLDAVDVRARKTTYKPYSHLKKYHIFKKAEAAKK